MCFSCHCRIPSLPVCNPFLTYHPSFSVWLLRRWSRWSIMFDCGVSDVGQLRFTGTASCWQVCVSPVGNWHFLVFSGLIPLAALTGFLALTHTGHQDTYWEALSGHCYPVILCCPGVRAREECVCAGACSKNNIWLCDSILWGDFVGHGASLQHPVEPEQHERFILGNTWQEDTVTLSHYLLLSVPFLFIFYLFLTCT